jgi:hypothetical protein
MTDKKEVYAQKVEHPAKERKCASHKPGGDGRAGKNTMFLEELA